MIELAVIIVSAFATAIGVNWAISVSRRHEEKHCVRVNVQHVLDDAADVSLSVKRLTHQLGGRT